MSEKRFQIVLDNSRFIKQIEEANVAFDKLANKINKARSATAQGGLAGGIKEASQEGDKLNNIFSRTGSILAGIFATQQIGAFVQQVASVRGQFQQLEISFTTMLGSAQEAEKLMGQLTETAAKTPFDLQGVASSAKSLLAYGFAADQVNETIVRLGDVAAGLSQPLGDIVYLYGTLRASGRVTNIDIKQFANRGIPIYEELAKVLGVSADKINELVSAGKVGFPHIEQAFKNLTSEGGKFANLMAEQSKSITGQLSNLGDAFDMMLNNIGKSSQGLISGSISVVASLVENYEQVGRVLVGLIATYGVYKAAVITNIALTRSEALAKLVSINATKALTAAQTLLNRTMLANPYVLVAVALSGLVAAAWAFADRTTAAERAQKKFNDEQEQAKTKADEHRRAVEELISVATNEALATFEREKALSQLKQFYPQIFSEYDVEKLKLADILKLKQRINEEEQKKIQEDDSKREAEALDRLNKAREKWNNREILGRKAKSVTIRNSWDKDLKRELDEAEKEYELYEQKRLKENDRLALSRESLAKKSEAQIKANIDAIERLRHKMKSEGKESDRLSASEIVQGSYSESELSSIQQQLKAHLEERNKTYKDYAIQKKEALSEANKAEKEYNDFTRLSASQLKEWSKNNGYKDPDAHRAELKANLDEAKKKAKEFEESKDEVRARAESLRRRQEAERRRQEDEDQAKAIERSNREIALDMRHQEAQLMEDGFAKEMELLDIQHERALEANKARGEEMIQQLLQQKKREWEAKHDASKEVYVRPTLSVSDLPQEQQQALNSLNNIADKQRDKGRSRLFKEMLDGYKDYEQRKDDIRKKYDVDRKAIEESEMLSALDKNRYIIELERKRGEAIKEIDEEILSRTRKNNALFIDLFKDNSDRTINQMKRTIEAVEQTMQYVQNTAPVNITSQTFGGYSIDAETLKSLAKSPEEIKAFMDALRSLKAELSDTSPIDRFALDLGKAISKMKEGAQKGDSDLLGDGITKAGQAVKSITPMIEGLGKSMSAVFGVDMANQIEDLTDLVDGLGGIASGVGKIISGNPAGILEVFNSIGALMEKSNKIEEENRRKELKAIQEITRAQNEYNLALLKRNLLYEQGDTIFGRNGFGKMVNDVKVANDALKQLNETIKGGKGDIDKLRFSGVGAVLGGRNLTEKEKSYAGLASVRIKSGTAKDSGLLGTGLWARSYDVYKSILDVYPQLIGKTGEFDGELAKVILSTREFEGGQKEALEQAVRLYDQHQEAMKSVKQGLENIFGGLGQQIGDELTEAFKRGEDAGKAFGRSIGKVFENFIKQVAYNVALAKPLEEASEEIFKLQKERGAGKITDDQLIEKTGEVLALLGDQLDANKALYEKVLEKGKSVGGKKGLDAFSSSDTRTSSAKGIAQASQESIDTMVGQGYTQIVQGDKMIAIQERMAKAIEGLQLHRLSDINQKSYQELALIRELTERVESNTASIKSIGQDIQRNGLKLSR